MPGWPHRWSWPRPMPERWTWSTWPCCIHTPLMFLRISVHWSESLMILLSGELSLLSQLRWQIEVVIVHAQQRPACYGEANCRAAPSDEIQRPVVEQHRGQMNRLRDGQQQRCPRRDRARAPQSQTEDGRADEVPEDKQGACQVGHRPQFQSGTQRVGGRPIDFRMTAHQRGAELAEGIADRQTAVADDGKDQ